MAMTLEYQEAECRMFELLALVEQGEEIVISKHERPVARLVPYVDSETSANWSEFWDRVDSRLVAVSPAVSRKDDIESGRA